MLKLYTTSLCLSLCLALHAQIDPPCGIAGAFLCDNFDAYETGSQVGPGASWWTTWSGVEGGTEDGTVTDAYAYSGANSLLIPGNVTSDVVLRLGDQSSGVWRLEWMCYLPNGATGYYNIQESETPGIAWNLEVLFGLYDYTTPAPSGEGVIMVPVEENISYPVDTWFKVEHIIDLDANTCQYYIDGALVTEFPFTGNIGGCDFYSIDGNVEMYLDDVLLIELVPTTYYADTDGDTYGDPDNTISVAGEAPDGYVSDNTDCDDTNAAVNPGAIEVFNGIDDDCDEQIDEGTVGIADPQMFNFAIYPNPADDVITIQLNALLSSAQLLIFDQTGRMVNSAAIQGTNTISIPVNTLASGIYQLQIMHAGSVVNRQFIVE